jgi:hypothetical protein
VKANNAEKIVVSYNVNIVKFDRQRKIKKVDPVIEQQVLSDQKRADAGVLPARFAGKTLFLIQSPNCYSTNYTQPYNNKNADQMKNFSEGL